MTFRTVAPHVDRGFDAHTWSSSLQGRICWADSVWSEVSSLLLEVHLLYMSIPTLGKEALSTETRRELGMFICFHRKILDSSKYVRSTFKKTINILLLSAYHFVRWIRNQNLLQESKIITLFYYYYYFMTNISMIF